MKQEYNFLSEYKGSGGTKILEDDIHKICEVLVEKKIYINFQRIKLDELSCTGVKVFFSLIDLLGEFYSLEKVYFDISLTALNKKIRFKSLSSVSTGLKELEKTGLLKLTSKGNAKTKPQYHVNPFYFFLGTSEKFKEYLRQDIKVLFPQLYVKLFLK